MKILVPTDFSAAADKAIQYAISLVDAPSTQIIVYHAYIPFESGFISRAESKRMDAERATQLERLLLTTVEKASTPRHRARIGYHLDTGPATRAIVKFAALRNIDLIVMGTTGASALKETLLGSAAQGVLTQSSCPVIAVPRGYKPAPLRTIVFTTLRKIEDAIDLKFLCRIARRHGSDLVIWHFFDKTGDNESEEKLAKNYERVIRRAIRYDKLSFRTTAVRDVKAAIKKLSALRQIDLLVMVYHKRHGFIDATFNKSLTEEVVNHSSVPLISLPAKSR